MRLPEQCLISVKKQAETFFIFLFKKPGQTFKTIWACTERTYFMFGVLKRKYSSYDPLLFNVMTSNETIPSAGILFLLPVQRFRLLSLLFLLVLAINVFIKQLSSKA
jgi:hypothetical protein